MLLHVAFASQSFVPELAHSSISEVEERKMYNEIIASCFNNEHLPQEESKNVVVNTTDIQTNANLDIRPLRKNRVHWENLEVSILK